MSRKLPLGIQDFVKIREEGFLYVDKTALIHRLITNAAGPVFLSRPRRFGKSLLCSTLGAVFEGRRELFGPLAGRPALAIDGLDWEWKRRPVIRIDLNAGDYTAGLDVLNGIITDNLERNARKHGISLEGDILSARFMRLLWELADKYHERVTVLIDEYDKPLLSTIDNKELHVTMRNALKGFYGVLKSADEYLQFVLLTGVTKFSQVSVFSDLNNLVDISLDRRYASLCGISQEELERDFEPEIAGIAGEKNIDTQTYLDKVRRFYNGYRFSERPETVYNPFGLLNHFYNNGRFDSYWVATGTPSFLVKLIEEQHINILELSNKQVWYEDFQKYDVENMAALPVLYQSGYLTISGYDEERNSFMLDYPNEEVRASFAGSLVERYLGVGVECRQSLAVRLVDALFRGDAGGAVESLRPFFASIPYDLTARNDNYYQTAVHLVFTMLGLRCRSGVRIAGGRIDTVVETGDYLYCFEFKLGGEGKRVTAEEALRQIESREYLLPWRGLCGRQEAGKGRGGV